jgi:uroporphyrinogen-III decarboxylase
VDFFEKVIVPRYKRIGRKLADQGIDIWYTDCDGDIRPIIECFLESGINTMFPFEVNCSGHPGELLDKYGKELRIMGGVDKMVLVKDPAAIRAYLESLAPYVARGGFIPHCDHRCPPNVSQENYLAYLDIKEELFGM